MSTVYNEGPYAHWTEVNFPSQEYTVTVAYSTAGGAFVIAPTTQVDDAADLQGVFTGVDSLATLDTSLLPAATSQSTSTPTAPACTVTFTNYYTLSGAAFTTDPGIGWAIFGSGGVNYSVQGQSFSSWSDGGGFCLLDFNAPAFPAFIDGEKATFVAA